MAQSTELTTTTFVDTPEVKVTQQDNQIMVTRIHSPEGTMGSPAQFSEPAPNLEDGGSNKCCGLWKTRGGSKAIDTTKGLYIDLVNPKFKSFNRPMLLAIFVGVFTFIVFCIMMVSMMKNCPESNYIGTFVEIATRKHDGEFGCLLNIYRLTPIAYSDSLVDPSGGGAGALTETLEQRVAALEAAAGGGDRRLGLENSLDMRIEELDSDFDLGRALEMRDDVIESRLDITRRRNIADALSSSTKTNKNFVHLQECWVQDPFFEVLGRDGYCQDAKRRYDYLVIGEFEVEEDAYLANAYDENPEDLFASGSSMKPEELGLWLWCNWDATPGSTPEGGPSDETYVSTYCNPDNPIVSTDVDGNLPKTGADCLDKLLQDFGFADNLAGWGQGNFYVEDVIDASCDDLASYGFKFDDGAVEDDDEQASDELYVTGPASMDYACIADSDNNGKVDHSDLAIVLYRNCPDKVTVLGAALGWAAMIELVVTILSVGCLMAFGCLKNDNAPFRVIVRDVISQSQGTSDTIKAEIFEE